MLEVRVMGMFDPGGTILDRFNRMETHLAQLNATNLELAGYIKLLAGSLDRPVRLSMRQSQDMTLVGTEQKAVNDWEEVVALTAFVTGAPLAAPGISLVFDDGSVSPTFQQTLSGPVGQVQSIKLSQAPPAGQVVVITLLTSWVGGWDAR